MKKNYTLKSQFPLFLLLLFGCVAIGQKTHTVVEKKVAKSNTTVASPKGNSPSVFYNSIKRTSPISESVARQSNGVSSTVLDVCDIDQSNFNFPDTTTSLSFGQSFMAQCNSDMTSVSIFLGTTTP